MTTQPEGADMAFPLWVARVTRHPLGDRPHVRHLPEVCLPREEGQGLLHEEAYDTRFRRALPRRQGEDGFSFKRASCRPYSTQAPPTPCVRFVLC